MEGAVALVLALLSIPFILPFVSWFMARKLRDRVDELEERIAAQDELIRGLTQIGRIRREGTAPEPKRAAEPTKAPAEVLRGPVAAPPGPAPPIPVPEVPLPPPPPLPPSEAVPAARPPRPPRAPIPPRPPEEPPPFEPAEAPSPEPGWTFDWERLVGVKLFSAIAGIALVFAGIFFLRYSIDNGWLQPPVRVAIGIVVAIGLLVACDRKAARKYPLLANAMDAAAIAILFATFFAAHSLWNLIPGTAAFGLLALVTLTAVLLSIRHDSLFIAVLGLLGGFATPILLSTGENQPVPLFAYLLLLNVGLAWVAYKRGWTILSTLTLVLTTLYQWGWVARFLDAGQLPLALGIFTIFPVVGYASLAVARSRPGTSDNAGKNTFEWTTLAASVLPVLFAVYLAATPQFRDHFALLFGWVFLIDAGLLAIAITRSREILHGIGGITTLLVFVLWMSTSYLPGSAIPVMGFVSLFIAFYLAAPVIAARFDKEFEDVGEIVILVTPLLLAVFPILIANEPQASSAVLTFPALFVLVAVIVWRTLASETGILYFIAAFFALATEAVWSAKYLTSATLPQALMTYVAFAALYLGVPQLARRRGKPLQPEAGGGVVLILSLALLMYLSQGSVAATGLWGLALLLAILNAALFIESAAAALPLLALVGSAISWLVLLNWWIEAAATVGLLPSLLVVVGLALVMVGGHIWALRRTAGTAEASEDAQPAFGHGLWLALIAHLFLFGVAANIEWAVPPWPLFGALAVVTLAFSTAALAARNPAIHLVSTVMVGLILLTWRSVSQPGGYAEVGIAAFGVLAVFALAWILVIRRFAESAASTAAAVLVLSEVNLILMVFMPSPASFAVTVAAHVIGFSVLLALTTRYEWAQAASGFSILAGGAAAAILFAADHTGRDVLIHTAAIYAPFALYPLVLGSRARETRDPYIAALIAGVWCFLTARQGMAEAQLDWMVGVVPVAIGAVTTLHLSQLLRIQPAGTRDLGRLALVAGAALAFLTVAIPLQLEQRWITIGWALEGAAVAWLYTRIPHRGLLLSAFGLLAAVFVRLALNPEVFRYEPRGDMRIVNWYLYTYVIAAAAMGLAAWWIAKTDDLLAANLPRLRYLLPAGAVILLFLLLNIEIADYYSDGPDILFRFGSSIQQDLTYTIAWLIFGIIMLAAGIIAKARGARVASVAMIAVTTFKCFLYDLGSLEGLYRVGAFVGLAVSLALVSLALQKYVLTAEKERTS
jgi:hypothetical protein